MKDKIIHEKSDIRICIGSERIDKKINITINDFNIGVSKKVLVELYATFRPENFTGTVSTLRLLAINEF